MSLWHLGLADRLALTIAYQCPRPVSPRSTRVRWGWLGGHKHQNLVEPFARNGIGSGSLIGMLVDRRKLRLDPLHGSAAIRLGLCAGRTATGVSRSARAAAQAGTGFDRVHA